MRDPLKKKTAEWKLKLDAAIIESLDEQFEEELQDSGLLWAGDRFNFIQVEIVETNRKKTAFDAPKRPHAIP